MWDYLASNEKGDPIDNSGVIRADSRSVLRMLIAVWIWPGIVICKRLRIWGLVGTPASRSASTAHLLIVMRDKGQDLHHLPITTWALEQEALQPWERLRQIEERRPIAPG